MPNGRKHIYFIVAWLRVCTHTPSSVGAHKFVQSFPRRWFTRGLQGDENYSAGDMQTSFALKNLSMVSVLLTVPRLARLPCLPKLRLICAAGKNPAPSLAPPLHRRTCVLN